MADASQHSGAQQERWARYVRAGRRPAGAPPAGVPRRARHNVHITTARRLRGLGGLFHACNLTQESRGEAPSALEAGGQALSVRHACGGGLAAAPQATARPQQHASALTSAAPGLIPRRPFPVDGRPGQQGADDAVPDPDGQHS